MVINILQMDLFSTEFYFASVFLKEILKQGTGGTSQYSLLFEYYFDIPLERFQTYYASKVLHTI